MTYTEIRLGRLPMGAGVQRYFQWLAWRGRFFEVFIFAGVLSLCVDALAFSLLRQKAPNWVAQFVGFSCGAFFAAISNASFNFRVPRERYARTIGTFALVSLASYILNFTLIGVLNRYYALNWSAARFVCAAPMCGLVYLLHLRLTFPRSIRNVGIAIYATDIDNVERAYRSVGNCIDHIHVDLVDETFNPNAAPINAETVDEVRKTWRWQPVFLHIMSSHPLKWVSLFHYHVDTVIFHARCLDDPWKVIAACRLYRRRVGIAWDCHTSLEQMLPFLAHVDYLLVLGITEPGRSGQALLNKAVDMARLVSGLSARYGYKVIFDGGVSDATIERIQAELVVSQSALMNSKHPAGAVLKIKCSRLLSPVKS